MPDDMMLFGRVSIDGHAALFQSSPTCAHPTRHAPSPRHPAETRNKFEAGFVGQRFCDAAK